MLDSGAGVVTTRSDVHYVVTEHGMAYLQGKTLRQRAEALIAVADPRFRTVCRISRRRRIIGSAQWWHEATLK